MGRHSCCQKQKLRKGLWSPEEDEKLVNFVNKYGHGCWSSLPKQAGLQRCGKSCRLRWINYLRPDLKRGTFSHIEEKIIIELHSILGNRWSQIASHLPGRTDNEIKNFWNSCIKKKLKQAGIDPNTHKPLTNDSRQVEMRANHSTVNCFSDLSLSAYKSNSACRDLFLANGFKDSSTELPPLLNTIFNVEGMQPMLLAADRFPSDYNAYQLGLFQGYSSSQHDLCGPSHSLKPVVETSLRTPECEVTDPGFSANMESPRRDTFLDSSCVNYYRYPYDSASIAVRSTSISCEPPAAGMSAAPQRTIRFDNRISSPEARFGGSKHKMCQSSSLISPMDSTALKVSMNEEATESKNEGIGCNGSMALWGETLLTRSESTQWLEGDFPQNRTYHPDDIYTMPGWSDPLPVACTVRGFDAKLDQLDLPESTESQSLSQPARGTDSVYTDKLCKNIVAMSSELHCVAAMCDMN